MPSYTNNDSGSSGYNPFSNESPPFAPGSPAYVPNNDYANANNDSGSSGYNPFSSDNTSASASKYPSDLQFIFMDLSREEQMDLLKKPEKEQIAYLQEIADKKTNSETILNVEEEKKESTEEGEQGDGEGESEGTSRKIILPTSNESTDTSSTNRKIIL